MKYIATAPDTIHCKIQLPASKSISNRALILNALCKNPQPIQNLSDCDDTRVMIRAFESGEKDINIGAAGTAMRFLTAYLAQKEGEWIITGTERMKNRPIRILTDALRQLGADIEYLEKEGYPPLKIRGKKLEGGEITLDGSISSQFISALMMIAPAMTRGLIIHLAGNIISLPYIRLTQGMMENFGIQVTLDRNQIIIPSQEYKAIPFIVENDWSAASYWYEIIALSNDPDAQAELIGLLPDSLQGDSAVAGLFQTLGVSTQFTSEGVILKKINYSSHDFHHDFVNEPDLAQTFVVTCCLKNIPFHFSGLQSLKIKETDRILALKTELKKLGYRICDSEDRNIEWNGERQNEDTEITIHTYEDHRMAMSFAPVALQRKNICISDPQVVTKSYPGFWDDLKLAGFQIEHF